MKRAFLFLFSVTANVPAAVHLVTSPDPALEHATPPVIDPVFDCYHTNSAWGYTLSGSVIDSSGKLWSYGKLGQAWLPTPIREFNGTYLTTTDLQAKFAGAIQTGTIDAKALTENCALIAAAADGTVTQTDTGTRDAGTSVCHAYIRDETKQRYRDIELGSDGGVCDTRVQNSAPEAQTLLTWLKAIGVAR